MLDDVTTISEQPTSGVGADLPSRGSTPADRQGTEQPEQPAEGEKNKGSRPTQIGYAWHVYVLAGYYILFFVFLFWCLIDVWSGQLRALTFITGVLPGPGTMDRSMLVEISFAAIGGFAGSIEYHIKSLFHFYTKGEYDPRQFAKYLTAPFEGAVLAVIVLSLIRGGITMLSGTGTPGVPAEAGTPTVAAFAALAIGALVGFGMREVVSWLLALVRTMFAQQPEKKIE
jgi:hypothetical protein